MTWPAIWAFIRRIPAWVWLVVGSILSLGVARRYRQRALTAEATTERTIEVADMAIVHLADVAEIDAGLQSELDEIATTHTLEHAAIDAEGQQPGEFGVDAVNRLRESGRLDP